MKTLYNIKTGEPSKHHAVDAREMLQRGGWSETPVVPKVADAGGGAGADLEDMTVNELRALAADKNISLGRELTKKADIVAAIKAGLGE